MLNNGENPNLYEEVISRYHEYRNSFENSGRTDYISNRDPDAKKKLKTRKTAKKFIVAWIIIVGMIFSVIFHKQNFFPFISEKPLLLVIAVYLCAVLIISLLLLFTVRKDKYTEIISFGSSSISIYYSNNDYPTALRENSDEYPVNEIQIRMKRMNRKTADRSTYLYVPYTMTVKTLNQKEKYTLFAYDKADLFAFILFLEFFFKRTDASNFSKFDIEKMYYSHEFGLDLTYSVQ